MARSYEVRLKVCDTNGNVIIAKVDQISKDTSRITLPFIQAVAEDKKMGYENGIIRMQYPRSTHLEVKVKLTNYLESLFLGELANEDNYPSKHSGDNTAGIKVKADPGTDPESKGAESGSIHSRGGRGKSPGGTGRRKPKADMAKEGDSGS